MPSIFRSAHVFSPIHPGSFQVLPGELHDCVKPLPECEIPLGQRLLAELGPVELHVGVVTCLSPEILPHQMITSTKFYLLFSETWMPFHHSLNPSLFKFYSFIYYYLHMGVVHMP